LTKKQLLKYSQFLKLSSTIHEQLIPQIYLLSKRFPNQSQQKKQQKHSNSLWTISSTHPKAVFIPMPVT